MRRTLNLLWRSLALGLTAYVIVYTREVPTAYAQTVIDTDCSTDLDQPDTTYRLISDTAGSCVIAADNIILDGQGLYEVNGRIWNYPYTHTGRIDLTVRNLSVVGMYGYVSTLSPSGAGGDITIENSYVYSVVRAHQGNLTITDSHIGSAGGSLRVSGDIAIEDSVVDGLVVSYTGDVSIGSSEVGDSDYGVSAGGDVFIDDSSVYGTATAVGVLEVTDSMITLSTSGRAGVNVTNSTIQDRVRTHSASDADITITNSTVERVEAFQDGVCTAIDSVVTEVADCPAIVLTDTPPSLIVTPLTLTLDYGQSFNPFSGIEADDVKDGDLSDNITVIGEVGQEGGVYDLVYSVTDAGTTLFNLYDNATSTSGPSTISTTRTVTRGDKPTESTNVGMRATRKEKEAAATALPADINATIEILKTALAEPIATNDPETLKKLIDLVRQLIVSLLELLAAQGKVK